MNISEHLLRARYFSVSKTGKDPYPPELRVETIKAVNEKAGESGSIRCNAKRKRHQSGRGWEWGWLTAETIRRKK